MYTIDGLSPYEYHRQKALRRIEYARAYLGDGDLKLAMRAVEQVCIHANMARPNTNFVVRQFMTADGLPWLFMAS